MDVYDASISELRPASSTATLPTRCVFAQIRADNASAWANESDPIVALHSNLSQAPRALSKLRSWIKRLLSECHMCRRGSRCDRWAPRVSLSLSLLSKATVKYWAIRAFCQRESGVMGWGGDWESRGLKLDSWTQRHKGTTAKNPARAHTNTQTAAVGKTQIQVTHSLTPSLPDLFSLSRAFLSLALSNPSLQTSYAFTRCIVFNVPNTKSERLERRLWNLSHGMHKFPLN